MADTNRNWFEFLGSNNYDFSKYNYVLEIHFNSGGGSGSEIFVTTAESGITVEDEILKTYVIALNITTEVSKEKISVLFQK